LTPDLLLRIFGDKWLRLAVMLLLLAALAHQVSLVVWQFVPAADPVAVSQRVEVVAANTAGNSGASFQQQANAISRTFLFGKPEVVKTAAVAVEEAPETQLNYKLRGLYYSPDKNLSSAIIEVQANKSKHYLLGDELDDKITLAGIESDHILINRYGKIERLNLEKRLPPTGRDLAANRAAGGGSANQAALLRSYKKRYTSNPMALATRFQAIPVQQDGKNIGFKLKPLRGESLLKKLDFDADDVFTAVNGVALNNPFEALDALKSLTTASNVSVTFMRNGAEQTLDFKL
jgi:type II secretion system protein C